MNEKNKLKEAEYFFRRMQEEYANSEHFRFNLSAFLSAARSVLQYAYKETKPKAGGLSWYDGLINKSQVIKFFRNKRNIGIHQAPIKPMERHQVTITSSAYITDSVHVVLKDKDGNIKQEFHSESKKNERPKPVLPAEHTVGYFFTDWSGDEDIIQLGEKYLEELREFVTAGCKQGFIS